MAKRQKKERKPGEPLDNIQWETFAKFFATGPEHFGNGVESYLAAYDPDGKRNISYKAARTMASRLLTNANILARINELLDIHITDEFSDKQLGIVITQNADFHSKVAAIKHRDDLKSRITKKIDLTSGGKPIGMILDQADGK